MTDWIDDIIGRPLIVSGSGAANTLPDKFVIFATPSLEHKVTLEFFGSYLRTSDALRAAGIQHGTIQVGGDPFVAKARNRLVADFFEGYPDATHLFFLDDDIGWPPEAALRLIQSGRDVVAGVYPQKLDTPSYCVELDYSDERLTEDRGQFRANLVPGGFMCIARHVLTRMAAESTVYEEQGADGHVRQCPEIFRAGIGEQGKWWTEDYAFCHRCRAFGVQIWVDPDIEFTHSGRKRFSGNLADTLRNWIAANTKEAA